MSQFELLASSDKSHDLCFDRNVFLKESFSIDDFLREHRSVSLEVMRDDLGTFLKTLRLSMIELINKDYEDFVNLSKDLIGLNSGIQNIQAPLGQLRDEVLQVRDDLQDTISGLQNCLEQKRDIREAKKSLLHLTQVITSVEKLKSILVVDKERAISLDTIERAATEYNQLQFSRSRCKSQLNTTIRDDALQIEKDLIVILKNVFLSCISKKNATGLRRCLQIFASLDKVQDAHGVVRTDVVVLWLRRVMNETSKDMSENLYHALYQKVVSFVDLQLKELLEITTSRDQPPMLKGFNFITFSLWPELEKCLELELALIFQHVNPELFHRRFTDSMRLLEELECRCGSQAAVVQFREHAQYQDFLAKWNLTVYFKIRFQEIAGQLELLLKKKDWLKTPNGGKDPFSLKVTSFTFKCLQRCWCQEVFIKQLGVMFWKLSLQILSRYATWVNETLVNLKSSEQRKNQPKTDDGRPAAERPKTQENLDCLVCLASDVTKVCTNAAEYLRGCVQQIPNHSTAEEKLDSSLQDALLTVKQCEPKIADTIVDLIVKDSIRHISQVSDISRKYRNMSQPTPTKPSDYVKNILSLPQQFYTLKKGSVAEESLKLWLTSVFEKITKGLYEAVQKEVTQIAVVRSSIIRIKSAKQATNNLNMAEDEKRIRQQLVLDVQCFQAGAAEVGVDLSNVAMSRDLVELMEATDQVAKQ